VQQKKGGKIMSKFTYDIIYNSYQQKYVVFKTNGECFNTKGIFSSPSRKKCIEWLKTYKRKGKNRI
jgi:hypothetical protein